MIKPKRKRRTPAEAREEILSAAEDIILNEGPSDLKFQSLANKTGLVVSNIYHHFGGVLEIKRALADRVLGGLAQDLADSLVEFADSYPLDESQTVMHRMYGILRSKRYSKLIGWMVLSTELGDLQNFVTPMQAIRSLLINRMTQYVTSDVAERLANSIIYNMAITALGEGLIGDSLQTALSMDEEVADGSVWLARQWRHTLVEALSETEQ